MSETIVAPAKRWIELHIDLIPIDGSQFKEVQCSDAHLEEIMIRFAQAHVQKAVRSIMMASFNQEELDNIVKRQLEFFYPLHNIK